MQVTRLWCDIESRRKRAAIQAAELRLFPGGWSNGENAKDRVPGSLCQPINVRQDYHDRAAAGVHVAGCGASSLDKNVQNTVVLVVLMRCRQSCRRRSISLEFDKLSVEEEFVASMERAWN
jgi:hypothetical protein